MPAVSNADAYDAFDMALTRLEAQGNVDSAHIMLVRKWRDIAAQKRRNNIR